jgi:TetR/AcrR family transcriptional repressor of mexJK operon
MVTGTPGAIRAASQRMLRLARRTQPCEAAVPSVPPRFAIPWTAIWPEPPSNSCNTLERALNARANGAPALSGRIRTLKERLFVEIVTSTVNTASDPVHNDVLNLQDSGDVEADLRGLARQLLGRVMQPQILQLRRLVIGEAGRFPELGRTFHEQGPGRTIAALATVFERLAARGVLQLEDPLLAAAHFNWLIMSTPLNQAMLLGDDEPPAPADLNRYADTGARVFLAAYGIR